MEAALRILVLGGDGYIGWPLALRLALTHPHAQVVIADKLERRRLVAEVGGNSVTPIEDPALRLGAFREIFGQDNLSFVGADTTSPDIDALFASLRPTHVYHLAQQASAPYSMMSPENAVYTVQNNEVGNLRVLWAIRKHAPDAHLIKLGSFGEYAKPGIDIAEGYFRPTWRGREASVDTPFPRASDDIYHITKINDTNFIAMACRKWGLRVTDVMQSTIFGVYTHETMAHPALYTRFDYDAVFGTVLNRFLTQAVVGAPLTVYGTGWQRTGLMSLEDSVGSLAAMAERHPAAGEHRVINHVTERGFCINELAEQVVEIAAEHGFTARIAREHDPRGEQDPCKAEYEILTGYVDSHLEPTPIRVVLPRVFEIVAANQHRIDRGLFPPTVQW
jgi:UDP-sulfoquinovose synthase